VTKVKARKICLVYLADGSLDYLPALERALKESGFDVETNKIPSLWLFSRNYVKKLKSLLNEKSQDQFLIFVPQTTELFLKEPDFTLIYSAYRSWFDHTKMRVVPHFWTPVDPPKSIQNLRWTSKPPLKIGFMGRSYANSRLSNVILKLPKQLKQWILRGRYLQHVNLIALMNDYGFPFKTISAFSRIETMEMLREKREKYKLNLDLLEKGPFDGSEREKRDYVKHLERNTYIICPRGTENYSFRVYEALARGRIPVIIDTDVVLPKEIVWDDVSIKVPYESLDKIYDIIVCDYESRSAADFMARQQKAFSLMAELRSMEWVKGLANELGALASSKPNKARAC
jgi:hypothetical protein